MRSAMKAIIVALSILSPAIINVATSQNFQQTLEGKDTTFHSTKNINVIDVPEWRVNDNWIYDGYLDVADFVASSGVSSNVETLDGTLDMTVVGMFETDLEGNLSLVYEVSSIGQYQSPGPISITTDTGSTNGCLYADMDSTEIIRASDLATFSQEATVDVYFDPFIFGACSSFLRQNIGLLTVLNTYSPPLENYDFPINVGESWGMNYYQETDYSGSSDLVTIPSDSSDYNSTSWQVVSQGPSGVSYPGCQQSYNISNFDEEGDLVGFNWFCPAIRGNIKSKFIQGFGFTAVHDLTSYSPSNRDTELSVELEYPLSPIGIPISVWVQASDQGQPMSDATIQLRYESFSDGVGGSQFFQNYTTDANGDFQATINSGSSPDNSFGPGELGSHGILAWLKNESIIGASSLIIDPDVHEIDLITVSEGVSVTRTREGDLQTLSPSGYNAVPGDDIVFSVPVLNRGLLTSPPSELSILSPFGSTINGAVPPLESLEEARIEVNWTVPENHPHGNVSLIFTVDPDEQITEDGNRTNNVGVFRIFIGAVPIPSLQLQNDVMTNEQVLIDASGSQDPDGGTLGCYFEVDDVVGRLYYANDCIIEFEWYDDGLFEVLLRVLDDEVDSVTISSFVTVNNRAPIVNLTAEASESIVSNPIMFRISNVSDEDTQNPSAPVDILWDKECQQGRVGLECTIIPLVEGPLTTSVMVTDDDGAITYSSFTINVTNLAPFSPIAEAWIGQDRLSKDGRGAYLVNENDLVTLYGQAQDSINDIGSLVHIWRPDAENLPDLNYSSIGMTSSINHSYNYSGLQLATFIVYDDDEASTDLLVIPLDVRNIPPTINSVEDIGRIQEDEQFSIEVSVEDTANDLESLVYCFDLDPIIDGDADGNKTNDCDVPSKQLTHKWSDSSKSPSFIVFHVMDDDGARASTEINVEVYNVPPTALASASLSEPEEGETIVLSANGTLDSTADMDALSFHWDLDTSFDSNGDGNPANDIDMTGQWIEFDYSSSGLKQVKLTVNDEDSSHSVLMEIEVSKKQNNAIETLQAMMLPLLFIAAFVVGFTLNFRKPILSSSSQIFPIVADSVDHDSPVMEGPENTHLPDEDIEALFE